MGLEPPPSVLRADRMRKEGVGRGLKTGAKTATKDQERDYLDRFRRLADDPSPLVPEWRGEGADPFAKLRKRLQRVQAKRDRTGWLKWLGRGRRLEHAYAQTLLALQSGKIPSFASMKFRGRDVKFVLRGNGLRDKLIAIHNHEDPDVRLLGYLDLARKGHVVLVSLDDAFAAYPAGGPIPPDVLGRILAATRIDARVGDGGARCVHVDGRGLHMRYVLGDLGVEAAACTNCLRKLDGGLTGALEAHVLGPGGRLKAEKSVAGVPYDVHPADGRPELEKLVAAASDDAKAKAKDYEGVSDLDVVGWADEALRRRLEERPGGHLLVGDELWLGAFDEAAKQYGATDLERRVLATILSRRPPRLRTTDSSINKLLESSWSEEGRPLLAELAGDALEPATLDELARQRPSDALAALGRALKTEERFAGYPRFADLGPPLKLAYDLFKAHRCGDAALYQRRLGEAVRDPDLKPLALAIARGFGTSAGIEWQYAPHEKDQALFWEPWARGLARAQADTLEGELGRLADQRGLPRPARRP